MLRGLDSLAEPISMNKILAKLFQIEKNCSEKSFNSKENSLVHVQLLRHWCQMNGRIFKSVI